MTRSIMCGLLAVLSVGALGVVPVACQSGGVGDPCTPEDEYSATFGGFHTEHANIESRSFQCATRICLVNHFQGRVSCPLGQDGTKLVNCGGTGDPPLRPPAKRASPPMCTRRRASSASPATRPAPRRPAPPAGPRLQGGACQCTGTCLPRTINGVDYYCQPAPGRHGRAVLQSFVCHKPGNCQQAATRPDTQNAGKDCCVPGTDTPVGVTVCGQCGTDVQARRRERGVLLLPVLRPLLPGGHVGRPGKHDGLLQRHEHLRPRLRSQLQLLLVPVGLHVHEHPRVRRPRRSEPRGRLLRRARGRHGPSTSTVQRRTRLHRRVHGRHPSCAAVSLACGAEAPDAAAHEAEQAVVAHLAAAGLEILGTNLRVGRLEIDVVARDGPVVAVDRGAHARARGLGARARQRRRAKAHGACAAPARASGAPLRPRRARGSDALRLAAVDLLPEGRPASRS